ncbi:MAG: aryl-sulfate sulfotransferase [Bacteroidetes bacterium]|nr:aryl-sulfate sulfotransferase [Bacteroidota bacterium]
MSNSKDFRHLLAKLAMIFIFFSNFSNPQNSNLEKYQYIFPIPGSIQLLPEDNIIISQGEILDESSLDRFNQIEVIGSRSFKHNGELILSTDLKTLIFDPAVPFTLGEEVIVEYNGGIKTLKGDELLPIEFSFKVSEKIVDYDSQFLLEEINDIGISGNYKISNDLSKSEEPVKISDLPEDFPHITINVSDNPAPGYIFLNPKDENVFAVGYLMILDNSGVPIYYLKTSSRKSPFQVQHNGLLTFWNNDANKFLAMDSSYNVVGSFSCINFGTDFHDIHLFPNGHSLLLGVYWRTVRMDTIVAGGDSAAQVLEFIIQEQDTDKNVIFKWRTQDHFQITDATEGINLLAHSIDPFHCNAIELDNDGNLLLSSRHLDEITKIDRQTGNIIWRWGGIKSKNNEFQFINDPRTFSHQHDIRRISNGNVTLFDNGNLLTPQYSRSLEYKLNETDKTAELVWEFYNVPKTFSQGMGGTQRLPNNNTVIGWGRNLTDLRAMSEVRIDGTIAFELSLSNSVLNYKAFRFPWKTNLFVTDPDLIFFESVPVGDSTTIVFNLISNSSGDINITGFFNREESYTVEHTVPFILSPYRSESIKIKFKPIANGCYKDTLHIRSDTDTTSRIAQLMILVGQTDTTVLSVTAEYITNEFVLEQNYPNPFNPSTTIRYSMPIQSRVKLIIYNSIGENIAELINSNQSAGSYEVSWDAGNVASGIYFYSIRAIPVNGKEIFQSVSKMILLK